MVTGSATVAVVTGVMTATFGGILRDLLAAEPSVLLRPEIYVTAALVGAAAFTALAVLGVAMPFAAGVGALSALAVRGGAIRFGWTIPTYRSRPGRKPEDVL